MQFEAIFKIVVAAIIGLVISSFGSMSKDVTSNKVKIESLDNSIKRTERMVNDIHGYLLRKK
tara:strand:- start:108 stop:293 length:186 start_codon:yes stop_codon:yes gene_type:complete